MQDRGAHRSCTIECRLTDDSSFSAEMVMHAESVSTTSRGNSPQRVAPLSCGTSADEAGSTECCGTFQQQCVESGASQHSIWLVA